MSTLQDTDQGMKCAHMSLRYRDSASLFESPANAGANQLAAGDPPGFVTQGMRRSGCFRSTNTPSRMLVTMMVPLSKKG